MKNIFLLTLLIACNSFLTGCTGTIFDKIGEDNETYQKGYRDGYTQGQVDTVKREYWVTQNRHNWGSDNTTKTKYYTLPTETVTPDGRKLAGDRITVPIVESK